MAFDWANVSTSIIPTTPALLLAFDIVPTPTALIANLVAGMGALLPCVLHASDYGSLLISRSDSGCSALEGRKMRSDRLWEVTIADQTAAAPKMDFMPSHPGIPAGRFHWRSKPSSRRLL